MIDKDKNIAIVGATGVVGKEIISVIETENIPYKSITLLASKKSEGEVLLVNGKPTKVKELTENSFKDIDYALFSAGSSISKKFAPIAVKNGTIVIDNTSYFRMEDSVPLVVPEVNGKSIQSHKGIIANPNCSTAQLVMALKPIHDIATITRIIVSTYQSVSGAGKEAIIELETHTRSLLNGKKADPQVFSHPIAFNIIPQIDVFEENGYTKEEMKLVNETKKIMDPDIQVTATAARVPVFIGHAESVTFETKKDLTKQEINECLSKFNGVTVFDNPEKNEFPTQHNIAGKNDVFIGRIRKDTSSKKGWNMWIVADNLRKGAALNAVQILKECIKMPVHS